MPDSWGGSWGVSWGTSWFPGIPVEPEICVTRVDLRGRLDSFFQNPNYYLNVDFNDAIQDGYDEVAAFTGCIVKSVTIPFANNRTYYDMLSLIPDYIGIYSAFNSVTKRWMLPTSLRKLDRAFNGVLTSWEVTTGSPEFFVPISYRYVAIYRKPVIDNYGNMVVFYRASAPVISDSTCILIPGDHMQCLEEYTITDLLEQNQEFTKAGDRLQEYVRTLDLLRVYAQNQRFPVRAAGLNP